MKRSWRRSALLLFVLLVPLVFIVSTSLGITSQAIGPGVAGQIHALAFDQDDPSTIYVGGDRFGVSRTTNLGGTWEFWNNGLENRHGGESEYVDDLLSIGSNQTNSSNDGVFAATRGGIYYRASGTAQWSLQTPPERFGYRYLKDPNLIPYERSIWFSTLAYDGQDSVFAGAGHARTHEDEGPYIYSLMDPNEYAPVGDGPVAQYSIWSNDLNNGAGGWSPVTLTENRGSVRQISCFTEGDGTHHTAFASSEGVFDLVFNQSGTQLTDLIPEAKTIGLYHWSGDCWGVAFDQYGQLYVLTRRGFESEEWPGVYVIDVINGGDPIFVGDLQANLEFGSGSTTWGSFLGNTLVDMTTLAVRANQDGTTDIIVGNNNGSYSDSYGGGFLHVQATPGTAPDALIWQNMVRWTTWAEDMELAPLDPAASGRTTLSGDEFGWVRDAAITPTVEFGFSPHDPDVLLAWAYHIPVLSNDAGVDWEPIYSDGSSIVGWHTRGCSEMGLRDITHKSDGRLVLASADWDCWESLSAGDDHLRRLTLPDEKNKTALAVETYDDYVIAILDLPPDGHPESLQQIKIYDGSSWSVSDHWSAIPSSAPYHTLKDLWIEPDGTLFTIASFQDDVTPKNFHSTILRGTYQGNGEWSWESLFLFQDGRYEDLAILPGWQKLIIADRDANSATTGGILCYDLSPPPSTNHLPEVWLAGVQQGAVLERSARMAYRLATDADGSVLYVGTTGERYYPSYNWFGIGTVLRLKGPFLEPPDIADWELLANNTGDTFGIGAHDYHTSGHSWEWTTYPNETAQRMTVINDLVVDPKNPLVAYAAVDAGDMHPANGVWKVSGQTWAQILGSGEDAPNQPPSCLAIAPDDDRRLAVGLLGQEVMQVTLDPVEEVVSLAQFEDKSDEVYDSGTGLAYPGSPYASLTFDYDANPVTDPVYDDERVDLMVTIQNASSKVFHNEGTLTEGSPNYNDETSTMAPSLASAGLRGLATADYDNDGWPDLIVTHASAPRLYHNQGDGPSGVTFEDVTTTFGLTSLLSESWTAAWSDYNLNGYPDLFIGRGISDTADPLNATTLTGLPDVLLENRTWCGEGFVDVSDLLQQAPGDYFCTLSAVWSDVDGDGFPDLFAWDPAPDGQNSQSRLWMNQGGAGFDDQLLTRFGSPTPSDLNSATVQDLNGDGFADLILATDSSVSVRYADGSGFFGLGTSLIIDPERQNAAVAVVDHDLNGIPDLLALPHAASRTVALMAGTDEGTGYPLFDSVTAAVGLNEAGPLLTAQCVDVTADGDPDLYLGNTADSNHRFYFQNRSIFQEELPLSRWFGVRIVGDGGTGTSALGAMIEVAYPSGFKRYPIANEWGLGSATAGVEIIGLGADTDLPDSATILWPDGSTQSFTPALGAVVTVIDNVAPAYTTNSFSASYVSQASGKLDLVFQWRSSNAVDIAETKIHLTNITGGSCDVFPEYLNPSDLDADYSVVKDTQGYLHRFEFHGSCLPTCRYQASAECFTTAGSFTTETKDIRVRACIDDIHFEE